MLILRAFASIWDFFNYLFGTNFLSLPPQTYGFFMALAFVVGILFSRRELARKTGLGIFPKGTRIVETGKGVVWTDVLLYSAIGYFFGLKAWGIYLDKSAFLASPQDYFLSMKGAPTGGIFLALLLGGYIVYKQRKEKLPEVKKEVQPYNVEDRIGDVLIIGMVGGVLGSKILDAFDNPASMSDLLANPIGSLTSGLSVLGGLWLVSILLVYYAWRNKIKILPFLDSLSPPFFLAYAIGRLGCQFAGDGCWGISTVGLAKPSWLPDFLWGNTYAHNVNRDGVPISDCREPYCMVLPEPHLQTPLYETIVVTLLFLILWRLRKPLTPFYGAMTGLFFIFNGLERFGIEFIRINTKYDQFGFELSQAQYMSICMLLIGGGLMIWSILFQKRPYRPGPNP